MQQPHMGTNSTNSTNPTVNSLHRAAAAAVEKSKGSNGASVAETIELCIIAPNLIPSTVQQTLSDARLQNSYNCLTRCDMLLLGHIQPFTFNVRPRENPSDAKVKYDAEYYVSNLEKQNSPILKILTDVIAFRCCSCIHTTISRRDLYRHGAAQLYHHTASSEEIVSMVKKLRDHMMTCNFVPPEMKRQLYASENINNPNDVLHEAALKKFFDEWISKNIRYPKSLKIALGTYHILQKRLKRNRTSSSTTTSRSVGAAATSSAVAQKQQAPQQQSTQQHRNPQQQHIPQQMQQQQLMMQRQQLLTQRSKAVAQARQDQMQKQHLQQQQQVDLAPTAKVPGYIPPPNNISPRPQGGPANMINNNNPKSAVWQPRHYQQFRYMTMQNRPQQLPPHHITYMNAPNLQAIPNTQKQMQAAGSGEVGSPYQSHRVPGRPRKDENYDPEYDAAISRAFACHGYAVMNTKPRTVMTDLTKLPSLSNEMSSAFIESPYLENLLQCFEVVQQFQRKEDKRHKEKESKEELDQHMKVEHEQINKDQQLNDENTQSTNRGNSPKSSTQQEQKKGRNKKDYSFVYIQCRYCHDKNTTESSYCFNDGDFDEFMSYFTYAGISHIEKHCNCISKHMRVKLEQLRPTRNSKEYTQFKTNMQELYNKAWKKWFQRTFPYMNAKDKDRHRVKDVELYTPLTWNLIKKHGKYDDTLTDDLLKTTKCSIHEVMRSASTPALSSSPGMNNESLSPTEMMSRVQHQHQQRAGPGTTPNRAQPEMMPPGFYNRSPTNSNGHFSIQRPASFHPNDVIDGLMYYTDGLNQPSCYAESEDEEESPTAAAPNTDSTKKPATFPTKKTTSSKPVTFHTGNQQFLHLINDYRAFYRNASKTQKNVIAHSIANEIVDRRSGCFYRMTNCGNVIKLHPQAVLKLIQKSIEVGGFGLVPTADKDIKNLTSKSKTCITADIGIDTAAHQKNNNSDSGIKRQFSKAPGSLVFDCEKANRIGLLHGKRPWITRLSSSLLSSSSSSTPVSEKSKICTNSKAPNLMNTTSNKKRRRSNSQDVDNYIENPVPTSSSFINDRETAVPLSSISASKDPQASGNETNNNGQKRQRCIHDKNLKSENLVASSCVQ